MKLKKEKKQRKKEILSVKDEKMRKKKEKLQKEREKWRKEKDEFRKREEDIARRKASQNAYKKKESGADFYEDQSLNATNLAFPDEPEEKREKPVNEEVKIEEEATIRILLSASQEKFHFLIVFGLHFKKINFKRPNQNGSITLERSTDSLRNMEPKFKLLMLWNHFYQPHINLKLASVSFYYL